MSGVSRTELREKAVITLLAAGTAAGARVYSPRTWPQRPDELPTLIVTTPSERKQGLGRSLPRFNSTISLVVMVKVKGLGADMVAMNADAENQLETLCGQVETTLMCSQALVSVVQQFSEVETNMVVSAESENVIGEASVKLDCEVYQEFYPASGDPLLEIDFHIVQQPLGLSDSNGLELADDAGNPLASAGGPLGDAKITLPQS